ncbi:MAG: dienelactone hydrolase family protein [Nitrososphaerales archaeon]
MQKSDGWDAYVSKGNSDLGLVVIHEVFGFNDYVKSVADTLAKSGYHAAAVDFYKGRSAKSLEEGLGIRTSLKREDILGAARAGISMLKQGGVKKFGTLGFCMGGGFALFGACNIPEVTCCVDFYGSIDNAEETANLKGPVLLILGSEDPRITPWASSSFLPAVAKYKKKVEVHLYPNALHAFHNYSGPNYNKPAADDAWERTLDFLSRVK